jgi:hypothetical protein
MKTCFQNHPADNVAVVLADAQAETLHVIGSPAIETLALREPVAYGHKVAVKPIAVGEAILKYNIRIAAATRDIQAGEWVHLHNCASDYDARSSTLDIVTGAATDTEYE